MFANVFWIPNLRLLLLKHLTSYSIVPAGNWLQVESVRNVRTTRSPGNTQRTPSDLGPGSESADKTAKERFEPATLFMRPRSMIWYVIG